jgi:hypothetical protein
MSKKKPNWKCTSQGPQNNGCLDECNFEFYWDPIRFNTPHCPTCGGEMTPIPDGPSVSDLLREGFRRERKKENK